jgi:hypothetical protein
MPILDIQKRARELGRIRLGQVVVSANGKTRPEKIDRFRFTSYSRELLDQVAALYGGQVGAWQPQGGGPAAFEVLTDAKRVPILVPPQPVSQWYELWSGGGCQRRCDGTTELLSADPCMCSPEPEARECKPTTRLNVMLRDVPGLGVWRLESHGYYAAVELPAVAEFLASTRGYVPAALVLEERISKRNGQTRRYMVPAIEVEQVTPAQLLAGQGGSDFQPPAIGNGDAPALDGGPSWQDLTEGAATLEELHQIWKAAAAAGALTDDLKAQLTGAAALLKRKTHTDGQASDPPPDPNVLWSRILAGCPDGWTTADVEVDFERATGVKAEDATAADMTRYLNSKEG